MDSAPSVQHPVPSVPPLYQELHVLSTAKHEEPSAGFFTHERPGLGNALEVQWKLASLQLLEQGAQTKVSLSAANRFVLNP